MTILTLILLVLCLDLLWYIKVERGPFTKTEGVPVWLLVSGEVEEEEREKMGLLSLASKGE